MSSALSPSKTPNERLHLMSSQIAFTSENKANDDENCDVPRHHVNAYGKLTNTESLNETPNPVPRLITSTSWSSTANLLVQTTSSLPATLLSACCFIINPYQTYWKVLHTRHPS